LVKRNSGALLLYASNTFTGTLQIFGGAVSVYNSNALGTASAGTSIFAGGTLNVTGSALRLAKPITLAGTLSLSSVTLTGPISLTDSNAIIQVVGTETGIINSIISGPFGLTKSSFPGTLVLNSNNTYTGATTIPGGTLVVNGFQPLTPIVLTGGSLRGTGTVGTINVNSSGTITVGPGPVSGPGILTCSNVTFSPSTFFSVDLNGTAPGSGYDQLDVHGSVTLSNAILSLSSSISNLPPATRYTIINNEGSDPVHGTFSGLPEGAAVTVGTNQLHISYAGGDGNDVVLATSGSLPGFSAISRETNGQIQLKITGAVSGVTYTIQAATNPASSISWSNLGTAPATGSGQFSFVDTNAPLFPQRYYRAAAP
jgi:autotransporter-associated beta strand protein